MKAGLLLLPAAAAAEVVAARPPMGWSSWNTFGCAISEALIRNVSE